jgi:hypothetical protein
MPHAMPSDRLISQLRLFQLPHRTSPESFEKRVVRFERKEYVQDGDVPLFRFNV